MTYKLSDKLEANLRIGKHCIVKNIEGGYRIISPFKDNMGDYRFSGTQFSIEKAKDSIGRYAECDLTEYDDDFKWVGTYTPEYEGLKKGQKVELKDGSLAKIHAILGNLYIVEHDGVAKKEGVSIESIQEVLVDGEYEEEKTIRQPKQITRAEIAQKLGIEGEIEIID